MGKWKCTVGVCTRGSREADFMKTFILTMMVKSAIKLCESELIFPNFPFQANFNLLLFKKKLV